MRYHRTAQDVLDREIVPLLDKHAKYFDLAGFGRRFIDYDPDKDVYFMPEDTPWAKVSEHVLRLDVHWNAAPDEHNALYEVYTPYTRSHDTIISSCYFKATGDAHESLSALDSALEDEEGLVRGIQLTTTGDYESFNIYWIS